MRNGVNSKKKIIYRVLQFVCGFLLGHACFAFYDVIICGKGKVDSHHRDILSHDHVSINSTSNANHKLPLSKFESKTEFLEGDGMDYQEQKMNMTTGGKNKVDAIYSGNLSTLAIKHDLLLVGVLTSNKFLKSRACTVYNTWAKHIQVRLSLYFIASLLDLATDN